MNSIQLTLTGAFRFSRDGLSATSFRSAKVQALLAYLALAEGRPISRAQLAGLFWDGYAQPSAMQSLRMALVDLRKLFEPSSLLEVTRQTVCLRTHAPEFWCDLVRWNELLGICAAENFDLSSPLCRDALREAQALAGDEVLQGLVIDSPPFAQWQAGVQAKYAKQVAHLQELYGRMQAGEGPAGPGEKARLSPLLERDEQIATAQSFLHALHQHRQGVLLIRGEAGLGCSRVLAVIGAEAAAEGFALVELLGQPPLTKRVYGALSELRSAEIPLPQPLDSPADLIAGLRDWSQAHPERAILLVVDDFHHLDSATQFFLQNDLLRLDLPRIGLVVAGQDEADGLRPFQTRYQRESRLLPLSPAAAHTLARHILRGDPPPLLLPWLHKESGGKPKSIHNGLKRLIERQHLRLSAEGWLWLAPEWEDFRLEEANGANPIASGQLPLPATDFVGRARELSLLKKEIHNRQLVTIAGVGGSGKTRLAVQVAAESQPTFPDGVHFIPLAGVSRREHLLSTLANELHIRMQAGVDPQESLAESLRGKQMLLVLDNFEQLRDEAGLLTQLSQRTPGLRLLVTSREPLHLPDESIYTLGGLSVPGPGARNPENSSAVQLFFLSARSKGHPLLPSKENTDAVSRICQQVSGMPLGIELAAAYAGQRSLGQIAEDVQHNLAVLQTEENDIPDRQRSLNGIIAAVWSHFSAGEQRVLRWLALFQGGFGREGAQQVADASPFFLDSLLARAYLSRDAQGRFAIHELLRQFAQERLLAQPQEVADAKNRHSAYFASFLQERERALKNSHQVQKEIAAEINNIRAGWERAIEREQREVVAAYLTGLDNYLWIVGSHAEAYNAYDRALQQLFAGGEVGKDWALLDEALIGKLKLLSARQLTKMARGEEGIVLAGEVITHSRRVCNRAMEAQAHLVLGTAEHLRGDLDRAATAYQQALALSQEADDTRLQFSSTLNLGMIASSRGEYQEAVALLNQAGPLASQLDDHSMEANYYSTLGRLHHAIGNLSETKRCYELSFQVFQGVGDHRGTGLAWGNLGTIANSMGDWEGAQTAFESAFRLLQGIRDPFYASLMAANLSFTLALLEEFGNSRLYALESIRLAREAKNSGGLIDGYAALGQALLKSGELDEAEKALGLALEAQKEAGMEQISFMPLFGLAQLYLAQEQWSPALEMVQPLLDRVQPASPEMILDPYEVYWVCYRILRGAEDSQAISVLEKAHTNLLAQAAALTDPDLRLPFLHRSQSRRLIVAEMERLREGG